METFQNIARGGTPYRRLYTSDYILDEAVTLVRARSRNHKLSVALGRDLLESKTIVLLKIDETSLKGSWDLYKNRPDIALSFTDATSAFLAKKHYISDIFTYDGHFESLGFHAIKRLGVSGSASRTQP